MKSFRRNITVLALSQALMMSGQSIMVTTAALVGFGLARDKSLSTLPVAALFVAMMLTSIPASLLMERIGRKWGFLLSTLPGIFGAGLAAIAITGNRFWLYVSAMACIGVFNGFGNYFRFAAADAADAEHKSRAVSLVLAGGVVAAVAGPNLANWSRDLIDSARFAGSYITMVGLYVLSFIVLGFLNLPPAGDRHGGPETGSGGRSLAVIAAQPAFITALICGMFGYGVMTLVMTATPLAMGHYAHAFSDTVFVIQWHGLGMFAPSFVTGYLIKRFGILKILFTGGLLGLACVAINLLGTRVVHFWIALLLLGISWNFLFIGATVLLTEAYKPEEQAKTQAVNDFAVFSTVALASVAAGALQNRFGWQAVNLGMLPVLVLILASVAWLASLERKQEAAALASCLPPRE